MGQSFGHEGLDKKGLAQELSNCQTYLDKLKVFLQKNEVIPEKKPGEDEITSHPGVSGRNELVRAINIPIQCQESGLALTEKLQSSLLTITELLPEEVHIEIKKIHPSESNNTLKEFSLSLRKSFSKIPQKQDFRCTENEEENHLTEQNERKRNSHVEEKRLIIVPKSQKKGTSDDQIKSSAKKSNKKKRIVQLYYRQESDIIDEVARELKMMLEHKDPAVEVLNCKSVEDLQNNSPAILLCINASKLGTDVSGAMKGLQYPGKTAVVVIHHKQQHALPILTTEKLLAGPEYQSLGRITDMAFLSYKGIYPCSMNDLGFGQLIEFIKSN